MHIPEQIPMRLIVGACRSGTTALLQVFAQALRNVHCVYRPIKTGLRHTGVPDSGIYHGRHPVFADRPAFVVVKETLGHSTWDECTFDPLENDAVIRQVRALVPLPASGADVEFVETAWLGIVGVVYGRLSTPIWLDESCKLSARPMRKP